jgi:hypothetical protein
VQNCKGKRKNLDWVGALRTILVELIIVWIAFLCSMYIKSRVICPNFGIICFNKYVTCFNLKLAFRLKNVLVRNKISLFCYIKMINYHGWLHLNHMFWDIHMFLVRIVICKEYRSRVTWLINVCEVFCFWLERFSKCSWNFNESPDYRCYLRWRKITYAIIIKFSTPKGA